MIDNYDKLLLCVNHRAGDLLPSCGARGSADLQEKLTQLWQQNPPLGADGKALELYPVHCMGRCHAGPTLKLSPAGPIWAGITAETADDFYNLLIAGNLEKISSLWPDPLS